MANPRITIKSENAKGDVPGVMFGDPKTQPMGVVVLQEWWGMNQYIQDAALDISKRGSFTTIVPDLYRGTVGIDREHAGHLMDGLDWSGAVLDIQGCVRFLLQKGCTKVGVMGFCMGGALSLASAVLVPEVGAASPYYGICSDSLADLSTIKIPVQCHFGDFDQKPNFSSPADQEKLKKKLESGGVNYEIYSYPADHAFANFTDKRYNKTEAEKALGRTVAFFHKHLA